VSESHDHDAHDHDHDAHGHDHALGAHGDRATAHVHSAHDAHDHAEHAHGHAHGAHSHIPANTPRKALGIALALTLGFMGVEIGVGLWAHSLALLADAGHMLSDAAGLIASLIVANIALRPRSARNTYGFRRAEVLAALLNAALLAFAALVIIHEAVDRFADPPEVDGGGMLAAATGGLIVNLVAAWVLHRQGGGGLNVRSALLHVIGDALGSVAAIVAGVAVVTTGWRLADPVASVSITLLLVWGVWHLLREAAALIMETAPEHVDTVALEAAIRETPGVTSVHDLHIWSLSAGDIVLTAHVVLDRGAHGTQVARCVGEVLRERFQISHSTIQPEPPEAALVPLRTKKERAAVAASDAARTSA
jgi:cobalt-zinc-cadmium efflux system protein